MNYLNDLAAPITLAVILVCGPVYNAANAGDPWADKVIRYVSGTGIVNDFVTGDPLDDPTKALGEPTRFTSDPANFGGAVTPFQSPFRGNEVVSLGNGGVLVLAFDEPVLDDPANPFGIDLLIFGNAFYFDDNYPQGVAGAAATENGTVEVSQDGVHFVLVPGIVPDGLFPTLGYVDLTEPFPAMAGSVLTDFTRPVNPTFEPAGRTFADIIAGYDGAGGGAGVDLATVGLNQISFVRITNPHGSGGTPEVDALADVAPLPEPASEIFILIGWLGYWMTSGYWRFSDRCRKT